MAHGSSDHEARGSEEKWSAVLCSEYLAGGRVELLGVQPSQPVLSVTSWPEQMAL